MNAEQIKDFVKEKHKDFVVTNFSDKYKGDYDRIVVNFFWRVMNQYRIDHTNAISNLKKLKKTIEEFEEEGGKILDVYEEAQRLAEEEDEEEQKDEWENDWYDEHDEDEEPDESEFEYEPSFEQQAHWLEQHIFDLAKQHSDELENFTKSAMKYVKMRNVQGLDFINAVFREFDQLASSYDEIIENRIKVEKQWLQLLNKNKRNLIKAPFEGIDLEEIWNE